jgi:hypothetical protein
VTGSAINSQGTSVGTIVDSILGNISCVPSEASTFISFLVSLSDT